MTDGSFKFLNDSKQFKSVGWDDPNSAKLWRYNQHYFDDLSSACAIEKSTLQIHLLHDWVANNRPGQGTGWEPYPTSLRIVNWVKWCLAGHVMPSECLQSLAVQARWLNKKIEWHILANHLFANAKALVFVGLFFDGQEAEEWLSTGLQILLQEISEQILPDGGHFELSPMYHSIILEDVLDLINILCAFNKIPENEGLLQLRATAMKMLEWLDNMCHPDNEISFFNDAAFNIAPSPAKLKSYATRLNINIYTFDASQDALSIKQCTESGYAVIKTCNASVLLDVACLGPDYLPGHGHADTLCFEMSLFGKRLFVNRGTSQYGTGLVRQDERGTAAHNTVVVNGRNSSEVWSGFRVARRARPFGLLIDKNETSIKVSCSHDGYKRISGRPIHRRSWTLANGTMLIEDQIQGTFKTATAYFHFHPDVKLVCNGMESWKIQLPGCNEHVVLFVLRGSPSIRPSLFSPEFGIQLNTECLEIEFDHSDNIAVEICWKLND